MSESTILFEQMMKADPALYESILDSAMSYPFNQMGRTLDSLQAEVEQLKREREQIIGILEALDERAAEILKDDDPLIVFGESLTNMANDLGVARAEVERLQEVLADYENSLKHALDDHPDEEHCSCFPYLRAEVMSLRAENERLTRELDKPLTQRAREMNEARAALSGPGDGEPETEWPTAKDLLSWPKECRDAYVRLSAHYAAKEGMYAEEPAEPRGPWRCDDCDDICDRWVDKEGLDRCAACDGVAVKMVPAPPAEEPEEEAGRE